jgi:serine/threonine protein kinase, bacterial
MIYCLNPACTAPENPPSALTCQACGSKLLLRDRYLSNKILGRGGFGTTFLAIDTGLPGHPSCVIKQLRPVVSAPHVLEMARELFQREAATLGKVGNHPQLPRLLDYFEIDKEFYLVQEFVNGLTLQQEVRRSGPLTEAATKHVLLEVLPILGYLHANEVIHRDIKPANLIRRSIDNHFVLIDFGAVKDQVNLAMAANPQEYSTLTAFAVGTPGFAPPEQMAMRPVYASDIYALGITCLYLLTGKSPKDMNYDPVTGELLWRDYVSVSEHFSAVLSRMLEVSLRHRYQSSSDVLQALELEAPIQQYPPPAPTAPTALTGYIPSEADSIGSTERGSVSPAARSAVAIRSQQARLEASGLTRISPRQGAVPSHNNTLARKNKEQNPHDSELPASMASRERMDANALVAAYNRGRRDFTNLIFNNLILRKATLIEAIFHQTQLIRADLRGTNLSNANLGRANLNKANLKDCNLTKAYMSFADLEGADVRGANLTNAYLVNANLRGADLSGANLTGATVSNEQLALARTNWTTTFPQGKRGRH